MLFDARFRHLDIRDTSIVPLFPIGVIIEVATTLLALLLGFADTAPHQGGEDHSDADKDQESGHTTSR